MATQITNHQCPACTGPLQFSPQSGKLECEYCGSSFEVAQFEALYREKEAAAAQRLEEQLQEQEAQSQWDTSGLSGEWGGEDRNIRSYNCPSCSAELLCEQTTAATACPYCGNPSVVPGQFSGALRPDYVIPFRLDKDQAIAKLKGYYKGKLFLPKTFLQKHTVDKIQGVYVPFWLYDGSVSGSFAYNASVTAVRMSGQEEITETATYHVERSGSLDFQKVPVDASSKMPDEYMDALEPFDYGALQPFSTAYLPGFLADKYDVTVEEGNSRADKRCTRSLEGALRGSVNGYTSVTPIGEGQVRIKRGKVHYALLPVWLLNVKWNGTDHLFAINGQTGKITGKLPASKGAAWAFFAKLAVPLSILGVLLAHIITG